MRQRTGALFVAALFLGALGVLAVSRPAAAVSPSQVLVLYNAEWTDDAPLTDPGQDSKEIAEHYVRMRTDSVTGEKPYLLGLRCGVQVQEKGEWSVRFNGRSAVTGPFVARASCEDAEGKTQRWEAEYQDFFDVAASPSG